MEKAVVTEALGFIGFHLCSRLLEEGIEVTAVDNLQDEDDKKEKEPKLDYFGRNALFEFHDGDLKDLSMRQPIKDTDVCFCLTPCYYQKEEEMYRTLHDAFENIRTFKDAAANENKPFFILASSTDIYGGVSGKTEETEAISPISERGIMALVHESLFDDKGFPFSVLRFPEIYGSGQPSAGSLHQILQGENPKDVPLDLLHVKDAVDAFIAAANHPEKGVYNIASGRSHQWKKAEAYLNGDRLTADEEEEDAIWFCIDKARRAFGFQPEMSIEEGIDEQRD